MVAGVVETAPLAALAILLAVVGMAAMQVMLTAQVVLLLVMGVALLVVPWLAVALLVER